MGVCRQSRDDWLFDIRVLNGDWDGLVGVSIPFVSSLYGGWRLRTVGQRLLSRSFRGITDFSCILFVYCSCLSLVFVGVATNLINQNSKLAVNIASELIIKQRTPTSTNTTSMKTTTSTTFLVKMRSFLMTSLAVALLCLGLLDVTVAGRQIASS